VERLPGQIVASGRLSTATEASVMQEGMLALLYSLEPGEE